MKPTSLKTLIPGRIYVNPDFGLAWLYIGDNWSLDVWDGKMRLLSLYDDDVVKHVMTSENFFSRSTPFK